MKRLLLSSLIGLTCNGLVAQTSLTTAVDFTVTDVHGHEHNLFNILSGGKHVMIDFFFTTCPPCIQYQPEVNAVYGNYGCNEEDVFLISMDVGDSNSDVIAYETTHNGQHPSVSGTEGGGDAVNSTYGIGAYPTVILIAPNHSIVMQDIWPCNTANLNAALAAQSLVQKSCSTGIEDLASSFTGIAETYPNPASSESTIAFGVENRSTVSFEVYNVLGSMVAKIAKEEFEAGAHRVKLPVRELSAGNYFVSMMIDDIRADIKKISVIK